MQNALTAVVRQRQHLGDQCGALMRCGAQSQQRIELVEFGLGVILPRKPGLRAPFGR